MGVVGGHVQKGINIHLGVMDPSYSDAFKAVISLAALAILKFTC